MQSWCHQALASFFHIVCYFAAHSAAQRPRQPEVYIAHLLQSLDSLLDAYLVSKVAEHYYDPQGPTNDRLTLASHPHLLHFNLDGDGHSLSNESNGVKSLGGRSSVDGSGDSSVTSRSSAGRGASSRGGILPGIRKRRAIPLSTSRSKVSNVSSSSSGSSANSSLLAANASPASPLIHLDSAPSVEEAAAPQSLTNARLVVPKSDREVVVMRLLAYHISKLIALHCPAASLYHLLTDALAVAGETVDQRVASHKAVYLSAQQWHFKKLRAQSAHLARNGAPLRQAVISFYTACEVIDRSRATAMVHFVGTALLHHFVCEDAVRRSGETVAAARLVAFFRMILVRAKWTALLRAAGVGSHMDDAKLKEARKWKSLLRKDPRMGSPILDRDGNGSLKSPSRPPSRPSRLSPLPTPPQTATPSSPSKSAPPVPAPSSSSSAKLAKLLPSPAQISAVVASVLNTSATIHLSFPASLSALGPAPSPAASPTRRDCGDDLFTNLCIRAYLLGPTDQAAEAIATNLTAQSAHPMVYLFIQSKSRAEVFNPFVLLNRQFAERFSPHCIELPCEFAPLGDAPAADEKLSTGTAAEMRRWQVVVSGLAPYQQYRLVLEMDADLMRGLLVPFRASLPRGSMVRDEEMVATLSPLPPYRPSAFNAQAYAFQLNIPMSTGGSVPSAPEKVVARRKYASALSPTLCAAMRQSVSTPTDASMPRYPLYYAFDTDIEDGGGFGVVSQFSALVWIAWPSSRADRRKPSRYTVQRRWLLWMDRPMCEEKGLSEKAVIWKRGEGTKPVEIVFAGKGAWSVCKEEVEGVIERPGEGTEMHEVGTNDYISSLSSPFDEEVPRRCTALIRHFYAFLVSKEYQVDTGLIDTGIRLGLQYRVKVHNSYGVGPFSGSHWQSVNSVIPFEDLGVCILSRVLVDRDDLISRGKYAAVPGRDVMSLIMSHGTISENTQDNEDLIDCN